MTSHPNIMVHEEQWTVEGLEIAGLVSGPPDGLPVLALHGWLDNAASFDALRKALPDVRLVAIDMPGHGLSDHRSPDAGYQIWDDLPQLAGLIDQLGWERCVLLGHSRGALIGLLFAAAMPERISAFVTLDGIAPYPAEDDTVARQLRSYIRDREKQSAKPVRMFKSHEEYVARRSRSGEAPHIAAMLAERALCQTPEGFKWRGDPRLSGASAIKLNKAQIVSVLEALEMPVLNIWASPSERMKPFTEAGRSAAVAHVKNLTTVDIPGHHHWHMEDDAAGEIATAIKRFLGERLNHWTV